ncbi:MAG: ATP-dependent zinc metalloprotease FtsH [Thermoguttaceae bacterium]|nr:ATP-dependent zinc metalloprotease FtsH [Thermoguttaceae bacterium]
MSTNLPQRPKAAASDEKERRRTASDERPNASSRRGADDARTSGENERFERERDRERKREFEPFGRRGGVARSGDDGGSSFWGVLIVVFSLIFLWNAIYEPPRCEIPLGKLIELIEAGAPATAQNAEVAQSLQNAQSAETASNAELSRTTESESREKAAKSESDAARKSETASLEAEESEKSPQNTPSIIVEEGEGKKRKKVRYSELADLRVGTHEISGTATREVLETADGKEPEKSRKKVDFFSGRQGLEVDADYFFDLLRKSGYADFTAEGTPGFIQNYGASLLMTLVLIGFFIYFLRRMGAGVGAFGRNRGVLVAPEDVDVTFADVAGVDEAVEELREFVEFLRTPEKFQALGGRIPKGALLVGPPGTGKTLLAKAVAGEAGVPFFSLSGSDFVELYAGVGAARVRDLFEQAEKSSPCIVFIDELDALGKSRTGGVYGGGHDEREQTLNALLVEMDGFGTNSGTIVMAATNRPEILDSALLRSGRFDRQILVDRPDAQGREEILRIHAKNVKLDPTLDLREIATLTAGFVGADLAALTNEAALLAARVGKLAVTKEEFGEAIERVATGLEKKRRVLSEKEKVRVAYHECGHALTANAIPGTDPVHKISIIPRGLAALGYTWQRPDDERYLTTRGELIAQMQTLLAGTIAEELVFGDVSTGAQNDLERATEIARRMTTVYGMSRLGRVAFRAANDSFLDSGGFAGREYGERTAWEIDREVKSLVDAAAEKARQILVERKDLLVEVANRLLEKETMTGDELREIVDAWTAKTEKSAQPEKESEPEKSAQAEKPDDAAPAGEAS